jgi:Subtilase family
MIRPIAVGVLLAAGVLIAPAGSSYGAPPEDLWPPGLASGRAASGAVMASYRFWIATAKPGNTSRRIAKRYHAKRISSSLAAVYRVRSRYRKRMCAALDRKNVYVNCEPDTEAGGTQFITQDPLDALSPWRPLIVAPNLAPPPVTARSPLVAIIDDGIHDLRHQEFAGWGWARTLRPVAPRSSHGLATAAIAGAPVNGVGITGVWPGMRVLNVPLPDDRYACSDRVEAISDAIRAGAAVISLEYGARQRCFGEYVMVQLAIGQQIVVVAGAGNTFTRGNHREFPAVLPHVVTVAAIGADLARAPFSTANNYVDLSAPGVDVLTAARPGDAGDVDGDGYAAVSGTSFAAPMVAAAAAWVRAVRPDLGRSQVVLALLSSARDVASPGWDTGTGYGVLDIAAALAHPEGPTDPLEPNDDVQWIDGRIFADPDPSLGRGGRGAAFAALLDKAEDPLDLYRVRMRSDERARVSVVPVFGDPDVAIYAPGTRSVADRRRQIARSSRPGERSERLTFRNREGRAGTFYIAVTPRNLNTAYVLRLERLGRTRTRTGPGTQPALQG